MPVLVEQPCEIQFAENPVCICIEVNDLVSTFGGYPFLQITRNVMDAVDGDTFSISYTYQGVDYELDFVFALTPDNSGLQLPTNSGNLPIADYMQVLLDALSENDVFNTHFIGIIQPTPNPDFTSLILQFCFFDEINLEGSINIDGAEFPKDLIVNDGIVPVYDDLKIVIDLYVEDEYCSEEFGKKKTRICQCPVSEIPGGNNGSLKFNIQNYLESCLYENGNIPAVPPEFHQTVPWLDRVTHKRFFFRYGEIRNGVTTALKKSDLFHFVSGGLDFQNQFGSCDFFETLPDTLQLLSWLPNKRKVTCVQQNFISFINWNPDVTSIDLEIEYFYAGGGSDGASELNFEVKPWEKIHIPVGFCQLNLEQYGNICKYTVKVIDHATGNYLSQTIEFTICPHTCDTKYFLYENSLGSIDSIHFTGVSTHELSVQKTNAFRQIDCDSDPSIGAEFKKETTSQNGFGFSGHFIQPICNNNWKEEFEISEWVVEVVYCDCGCCDCPDPEDGYYKPICIEDGTFNVKNGDGGLQQVAFNYKEAWKDHKYTPIICPCNESAGLIVETEISTIDFCPLLPSTNARLYVRRNGNFWFFYGWAFGLRNQLIAAGATNIAWDQTFFDPVSGLGTDITYLGAAGGPVSNFQYIYGRMRVNGNNALTQIAYIGNVSFDYNGHQMCYKFPLTLIDMPTSNQGWTWTQAEWECEDKTPEEIVCFTITSDDQLNSSSSVLSEVNQISIDGGVTYNFISLPYSDCVNQLDLNGESILVQRNVQSSNVNCPATLKVTELVYDPSSNCVFSEPNWIVTNQQESVYCPQILNPEDFEKVEYLENGNWIEGIVCCIEKLTVNPTIEHLNVGGGDPWRVLVQANSIGNYVVTSWSRMIQDTCSNNPDFSSMTWTTVLGGGPNDGITPPGHNGNNGVCYAYRLILCDAIDPQCCYTIYWYYQMGPDDSFDLISIEESGTCENKCYFRLTDCLELKYFCIEIDAEGNETIIEVDEDLNPL